MQKGKLKKKTLTEHELHPKTTFYHGEACCLIHLTPSPTPAEVLCFYRPTAVPSVELLKALSLLFLD